MSTHNMFSLRNKKDISSFRMKKCLICCYVRSDCMDAMTDWCLRWSHMSLDTFSHLKTHLKLFSQHFKAFYKTKIQYLSHSSSQIRHFFQSKRSNIFFVSPRKHMLWELIRSGLPRCF